MVGVWASTVLPWYVDYFQRRSAQRRAKLTVTQFITNNYSIREVLAFPFLREEKQNNTKEKFAAEIVNVEPLATEGIRKF